jgi:hypothetical protein
MTVRRVDVLALMSGSKKLDLPPPSDISLCDGIIRLGPLPQQAELCPMRDRCCRYTPPARAEGFKVDWIEPPLTAMEGVCNLLLREEW